jgi:hypothetical protein
MGVTSGCVTEPGSLTLLILVGSGVFLDFVEKNTRPHCKAVARAACVFAVRNQHTKQVKPGEISASLRLCVSAFHTASNKHGIIPNSFDCL